MRKVIRFIGLIAFPGIVFSLAAIRGQEHKPAITYESLMDMRFYPARGGFLVETLGVVFPPPGDPPAELIIRKSGGETVGRVPLRLTRWPKWPAFGTLSPKGVPGTIDLGQAGDYVMAVKLGNEEITTMPFSLKLEASADPFNPKKTFYREGPWSSLAYLAAATEKPDDALRFCFWVSQQEIPGTKNRQQKASVHLLRGGQEVAFANAILAWDDWTFLSLQLQEPQKRGFWPFKPAMLTDGSYTVAYKVEGRTIRTFSFQVKGGQIQRMARNQLGYTPHSDFLSPRIIATVNQDPIMQDVFWIKADAK
ncbi:MAG TPA: hypothetical protein VNM72_04775 [Blastocatellia bacterium]|nr:hypothetical protein [Blastocatellia bacterium]